jgi:hypothetical protein
LAVQRLRRILCEKVDDASVQFLYRRVILRQTWYAEEDVFYVRDSCFLLHHPLGGVRSNIPPTPCGEVVAVEETHRSISLWMEQLSMKEFERPNPASLEAYHSRLDDVRHCVIRRPRGCVSTSAANLET